MRCYQLALAQHEAGDVCSARTSVLRALEEAPNFEKAQTLLLTLYDARDAQRRREHHEHMTLCSQRLALSSRRDRGIGSAARARGGAGFNRYFGGAGRLLSAAGVSRQPAVRRPLHLRAHQVPRLRRTCGPEGRGGRTTIPTPKTNFTKILRDISAVRPFVAGGPIVGSVLVALDDPALFKYPVSYMSEPGGWHAERQGGRELARISPQGRLHDLRRFPRGLATATTTVRTCVSRWRARCPERSGCSSPANEPIFDSFFKIDLKAAVSSTSAYGTNPPTYWGMYQDNDPKKRLIDHRERRQRHRRVVAVVGIGLHPGRRDQRDLQARRELPDLRFDPLNSGVGLISSDTSSPSSPSYLHGALMATTIPPRARIVRRHRAGRPTEERARPHRHRAAQGDRRQGRHRSSSR